MIQIALLILIGATFTIVLNRTLRAWDQQESQKALWLGALSATVLVVWVATALHARMKERDRIRRTNFLVLERIGPVSEPWKRFDFGDGFIPAFRVSFFNNGAEPITDATINVNLLLAPEPLPGPLLIEAAKDEQLGAIAPFERQIAEKIYPRKLTAEDTGPLNHEPPTLKFYVYGSFRYSTHEDRFFCRVFNPKRGQPGGLPYLPPDNIFEKCSTELIRKS